MIVVVSRYQPFSRQTSDALSIRGRRAEVKDGGEDALVIFYANILAMTYSRLEMGVHSGKFYDVVSCDVQTTAFGFEYSTELLIPLTKIHCFDDL